jgi:hypothetical protein
MSKIEVDAIDKQSGSTLTLGGSGTAVTLASGATQTGFGRTGTVDWQTTPKTTGTFTAVSGEGYFLNTSGGVITANLPAGVAGAIVSFADYAATWQTNNVTVTPNGTDKIGSLNENAKLNVEGQSVTFVFVDSTQGWINTMDSTSNVRGAVPFICASVSGSGNTLVTAPCCANVKVATFTGPGTFTVNSTAAGAADNVVSYLVIAGGGGGGASHPSSGAAGSGSGAGGYRELVSPSSPYSGSPLNGYPNAPSRVTVTATAFPIVVGAGGAAASSAAPAPGPSKASNGNNSSFSTIISTAGGYGGSRSWGNPGSGGSGTNTDGRSNGGPGGSGGGGNIFCAPSAATAGTIGAGNTPPVSPAQGSNGGVYSPGANGGVSGGGATGVGGTNSPGPSSAAGGAGATSSINGTPTARAGGGGAGQSCGGPGPGSASAGGGAGGTCGGGSPGGAGANGTANTGGGAGGGGAPGGNGGVGGSGIVIIRYKFQ